jgi:hypothetical protein
VEDKIAELSSKGFGSWAEDQLLRDYGQGLTQMADNAEFDFRHEAARVRIELKAARHKRDAFRFAYIRPTSFELCVCLGYHNSSHHYWLFDSTEIQGFLAHQHRGGDSFQLRIRLADERFQSYYSSRDQVRIALDPKATTVARHRNLVRLDPVLESIEGWHSVAAAISRRLEKGGLGNWQFVLRPLREKFDEPDLLPYPKLFKCKERIEALVHPKPVNTSYEAWNTANMLVDFLFQHLEEDMIDPM